MRVAAVVPAGGAGLRMGGAGVRKQYVRLAGEPVLLRAIRPLRSDPRVEWVILALPPDDVADPPFPLPAGIRVVAGGAERGDSVRNALAAVPPEADVVMVHDAARPLLTREVVDRVLAAVDAGTGAIAALPLADTLKRVGDDGTIEKTVPRRGFWRAQTPQAFPRGMILDAHGRAARDGVSATDDAELVERYGGRVVVVRGDARNLKITSPGDLALAERLLGPDAA